MIKKYKHYFIAFCIYFLAAFYITYPLLFHMTSLVTGLGDEVVIAWIQNWVIHALFTDPLQLFQANTYFPLHHSLAYSEHFIIPSIISIIPIKLSGEPIIATNFLFFSSIILVGFSLFSLSHYITRDWMISLLVGFLVIFSPAFLDKRVHLQIFALEWVSFGILSFIHFIYTRKQQFFFISLTLLLIQMYTSFLPGYFLIFSYGIISVFYAMRDRNIISLFVNKKIIGSIFVFVILLIPIAYPYVSVSKEYDLKRDIRDSIHYALQPEDMVYPNEDTRLYPLILSIFNSNKFFPGAETKVGYVGFIFTFLIILCLFYGIKQLLIRKKIKNNTLLFAFLSIALFGLLLSFGPALHWQRKTIHQPFPIILPYTFFYYFFPGFQGFRNSARWEMLFVLSMAITSGIFLQNLTRNFTKVKKNIVIFLLLIGTIIEFNPPMHFVKSPQIKDFPKYEIYIASHTEIQPLIHMPVYNWYVLPYEANDRMRQYYSTIHFHKMVNGASGFSPEAWQDMIMYYFLHFPEKKVIEQMRKTGIRYIVFHKDEYDLLHKENFVRDGIYMQDGKKILDILNKNKKLQLIKNMNNVFIFRIL